MGPVWDLTRLSSGGASTAAAQGRAAAVRAQSFADTYRGRLAGLTSVELVDCCRELEAIVETIGCGQAYARLRYDADDRPADHGALVDEIEELAIEVASQTAFFDVEWSLLEVSEANAQLRDPALERYAHHLRELHRAGPHRLSEPEERLLSAKRSTGVSAWTRLFGEQLTGLSIDLGGERVGLDESLGRLRSPDRAERRAADAAITAALEPGLALRGRILNTVLADHALDDRLRGFPHWLAEFNLDNEVDDAVVRALVDTVVAHHDIPHRWFALKARVLGIDRLEYHDVLAPLGTIPTGITWEAARETVQTTYAGFSSELGDLVARFFDEGWIDALPRPGKRTGAYCMDTVPELNPFVLVNFGGQLDDVLALAHELGHGVHSMLAAPRGGLQMSAPLTLSETASVFGETLTLAHLLDNADTPADRFAMLAQQLDNIMWTTFRTVAHHRYEAAINVERRERGELSVERLADLWLAMNREMLGDAVRMDDDHGDWWSLSRHVVTMSGYVYTYAFGQLLALSLYARFQAEGDPFVPRFLDLLRGGNSRSPDDLVAELDVDLADSGFWSQGLGIVDDLLVQAEQARR